MPVNPLSMNDLARLERILAPMPAGNTRIGLPRREWSPKLNIPGDGRTGLNMRLKNIGPHGRDVSLLDYSVMGKILVQGRDAEKYLNLISANDIAVPGRPLCLYPVVE